MMRFGLRTTFWPDVDLTSRQRTAISVSALVLGLSVLFVVPLGANRHFYFFDDTAGGAYGQWYELGRYLLQGQWPLINPRAWMAGNYTVEQFGLLNPVVWLIAVATHAVENAAVLATVVKWLFLQIGAIGVFVLCRYYGSRNVMGVSAGLAAATAGFTFYLDATAWVTNLQVWAYFPWVFWGLVRFIEKRGSYLLAFVPGYLLITVAYVQGTLMLIFLFVVLAIDRALAKDAQGGLRVVIAGVPLGLLAVTVYLPAVLSSGVTVRDSKVANTGFMTLTLNGLAVSSNPYSHPDLAGFWGRYSEVPYTYVAWFLPLLLLCTRRSVRRIVTELRVPLLVLILVMAFAMGPSDMGPLRFPIRAMPWVVIAILVIAARVLSDGISARDFGRGRFRWLLICVSAIYWLSFAANPAYLRGQVVTGVCMMAVVVALYLAARSAATSVEQGRWRTLVAVLTVVGTMLVIPVQVLKVQDSVQSFGQSNFPSEFSQIARPISGARGETLVIGDPGWLGSARWKETSFGNLWYVSSTDGINLYSPTGFSAFNESLCMGPYYGITCMNALDRVFEGVPEAGGTPLVDLLSIDTVKVIADPDGLSVADLEGRYSLPAGWAVADVDESSFTWVRESGVVPAGEPVWATSGVDYSLVSSSDDSVTIHVGAVPSGGGQVVFSRLSWPGYVATNANVGDPVLGYLLTIDLDHSAVGQDVTVTFRPPGFAIELTSFVASLAGALVLTLGGLASSRPARGGEAAALRDGHMRVPLRAEGPTGRRDDRCDARDR